MEKLLISSLGKCPLIALLLFRSFLLSYKQHAFCHAAEVITVTPYLIMCRKFTGVWPRLSPKLMDLTILILKRFESNVYPFKKKKKNLMEPIM